MRGLARNYIPLTAICGYTSLAKTCMSWRLDLGRRNLENLFPTVCYSSLAPSVLRKDFFCWIGNAGLWRGERVSCAYNTPFYLRLLDSDQHTPFRNRSRPGGSLKFSSWLFRLYSSVVSYLPAIDITSSGIVPLCTTLQSLCRSRSHSPCCV